MCASPEPKKFDLVHQTVSPHERVGSGDETNCVPGLHVYCTYSLLNDIYLICSLAMDEAVAKKWLLFGCCEAYERVLKV